MNTKIRTIIITLIASASFGLATIAPAVSQAATAECKPGDVYVRETTVNGKVIRHETAVCNKAGQWVEVVGLERAKISTPPTTSKPPVVVRVVAGPVTAVG